VAGNLDLAFAAPPFALQRLSPLLGFELEGDSRRPAAACVGPLADLRPDVQLTVAAIPVSRPLSLKETWRGSLTAKSAREAACAMRAQGPAPPGELRARLSANWLPQQVVLERRERAVATVGSPQRYKMGGEQVSLRTEPRGGGRAQGAPHTDRRTALVAQGTSDFQTAGGPAASLTVERPMVLELLARKLTAKPAESASGCSSSGSL